MIALGADASAAALRCSVIPGKVKVTAAVVVFVVLAALIWVAVTTRPDNPTALPGAASRPGSDAAPPAQIGRFCAPVPAYPTPKCTGVPPSTHLVDVPLSSVLNRHYYRVITAGSVIDSKHIAGDLLVSANDVIIKNSQIDGTIYNHRGNVDYSYTITDSTVGPATGCITQPGVGQARYTAIRVHIRGHDDGFRDSGNNILIRDSYVHQCSNPGSHADGIQDYLGGTGLLFDHNTVDGRDAVNPVTTSSVFVAALSTRNATISNNLLMGGAAVIRVTWHGGPESVVRGNRVVDKAWKYYPVAANHTCDHINWTDNSLVTIDAHYKITSTVAPLPCAS
jgi:hypothetical protein